MIKYNYPVGIHFALCELHPPELQRLLQSEADAFEEQTVLHPATMAEVVVLSERLMQLPHAEREGLPWKLETLAC